MITESHTDRQSSLVVRTEAPILDPAWTVESIGLEDLVLAYMRQAATRPVRTATPAGSLAMIWLSWRQSRTQAAVVFGTLAALAVLVVITGLRLRDLYDTSGIAGCAQAGDCDTVTAAFASTYSWLKHLLMLLLLFLPAVTGAFWGAPLIAREFETGTYQLAWTQSVTRTAGWPPRSPSSARPASPPQPR